MRALCPALWGAVGVGLAEGRPTTDTKKVTDRSCDMGGKNVPGIGNIIFKWPEVGLCLAFLKVCKRPVRLDWSEGLKSGRR